MNDEPGACGLLIAPAQWESPRNLHERKRSLSKEGSPETGADIPTALQMNLQSTIPSAGHRTQGTQSPATLKPRVSPTGGWALPGSWTKLGLALPQASEGVLSSPCYRWRNGGPGRLND